MKKGIRKSSAIITVAAAATPENLFIRSAAGTVARTVIPRKIICYSNVGAAVLQIGTGLGGAWAAIMPPFNVVGGIRNIWTEDELQEVEVGANLTVQSSVLGVQVQAEVEEIAA